MTREWYFVRRLRSHERPGSEMRFEVQVLDDDGLAVAVGYLDDRTEEITIGGVKIPSPVLEAARRKGEGQGDYVGADGASVLPF